VSPILGYKVGPPATGLDSQYLKVETTASVEIDLAPFVDGAAPRWVAIEVAPNASAELIVPRDIFQPALGTFIPQNVTKIEKPDPIFTINAGVPGLIPQLPTGNPGVIPLAYVYITAGASQIESDDIVLCRPVLTTAFLGPTTVQGGGLNVLTPGGTVAELQSFRFRAFQNGNPVVALDATTIDFDQTGAPNYYVGENYPPLGTEEPLYAYAILAPYPPGYDFDVADNREFVDLRAFTLGSRIPSNEGGNLTNGIVMLTNTPPVDSDEVGSFPIPTVQVNDSVWNGGTTTTSVYLGSVSKQDIAPAGLAQQTTRGKKVRFLEEGKTPYDRETLPSNTINLVRVGTYRNRIPLLLNGTGAGPAIVTPPAYEYDVVAFYQPSPILFNYPVLVTVQGDEDFNLGGGGFGLVALTYETTGDNVSLAQTASSRSNSSGGFTFQTSSGAGVGTFEFQFVVQGYTDPVLCQR